MTNDELRNAECGRGFGERGWFWVKRGIIGGLGWGGKWSREGCGLNEADKGDGRLRFEDGDRSVAAPWAVGGSDLSTHREHGN
jgi:hypothetical protein